MARRRRRKNSSKKSAAPLQPRKRRLRLRWKLLLGVPVVLIILLLAAPILICRTPVLYWIVRYATSNVEGEIRIGSADLNWFSPIRLRNVSAFDSQQNPMGTIDSVSGTKTLWQLTSNPSKLGTFIIERPDLDVVLSDSSSNWEEMLTNILNPGGNEPPVPLEIGIQVVDANIQVRHEKRQGVTKVSNLQIFAKHGSDAARDLALTLEGNVKVGEINGRLRADVGWSPQDPSEPEMGHCEVTTEQLPLSCLQPILGRWMPTVRRIQGRPSGSLRISWNGSEARTTVSVRTEFDFGHFVLEDRFLHPDRLDLESLKLDAEIELSDSTLVIKTGNVESSLGTVELTGSARIDSPWNDHSWAAAWAVMNSTDARFSGKVDLAQLMSMLPNKLRIRQDASLETGRIVWNLETKKNNTGTSVTGSVNTSDMVAMGNGKRIRWNSPIRCQIDLGLQEDSFLVNRLTGQSTFMSFIGSGTDRKGHFVAQVDLARFRKQFDQLFDLREVELGGRVQANLKWQPEGDAEQKMNGRIVASDLKVSIGDRAPIAERHAVVDLSGITRLHHDSIQKIRNAHLQLVIGDDRLRVSLMNPVADIGPHSVWPVNVLLHGNLSNWGRRMKPFLKTNLSLDGDVDLRSQLLASNERIEIRSSDATFTSLRAKWNEFQFAERQVRIRANAVIDLSSSAISIQDARITADDLVCKAEQLLIGFENDQPRVNGKVELKSGIERIEKLLTGNQNHDRRIEGTLAALLSFQQNDQGVDFDAKMTLNQPRFLITQSKLPNPRSSWQEVWSEPEIQVSAAGGYNTQNTTLNLKHANVDSQSVSITSQGSLRHSGKNTFANLRGEATYDLQMLSSRFKNYLGSHIRIQGKETRPFTLQGPLHEVSVENGRTLRTVGLNTRSQRALIPEKLVAETGIGWQSAHLYGLTLDAGKLDAKLENQMVTFAPLLTSVGGGKMSIQPRIDLRAETPLLTHQGASVLQDVRITPEMCRTWFRYVAPLVADATHAEGTFSVDLSAAQVPLTEPHRSRAAGRLVISDGRLGAGPLANQFLSVAQQIKHLLRGGIASRIVDPERAWVSLPQQTVVFEVRDGQVGHAGLRMDLGEISVETRGWVTIDERLALIAKIPIRDEWVERDPWLAGLRGQVLEIPVRGTFQQPRLDTSALGKLTQRAVTGAAEGVLRNELDKQLQRLFRD